MSDSFYLMWKKKHRNKLFDFFNAVNWVILSAVWSGFHSEPKSHTGVIIGKRPNLTSK